MNTLLKKPASNALFAAMFLLAVVFIALAGKGDARSDAPLTRLEADVEPAAKPCAECYVLPPFNPGYELPKDMKAVEPVPTF